MTPQEFEQTYAPVAEHLAEQTNLNPLLFLAQFALESAWGNSQVAHHNNLAGIKYAGGYFGSTNFDGFASYPSLSQFEGDYLRVLALPFYENVLASAGRSLDEQCVALGESIWSESHYGDPPGSNLFAYLAQLTPLGDNSLATDAAKIEAEIGVPAGSSLGAGEQNILNAVEGVKNDVAAVKAEVDKLVAALITPPSVPVGQDTIGS